MRKCIFTQSRKGLRKDAKKHRKSGNLFNLLFATLREPLRLCVKFPTRLCAKSAAQLTIASTDFTLQLEAQHLQNLTFQERV
jgi:hypothetical protein